MSDLVEHWGHTKIKYVEKIELDTQDWGKEDDEYVICITGDSYEEYDYGVVEEAYFKFKSGMMPTLSIVYQWLNKCLDILEQAVWRYKLESYAHRVYNDIESRTTPFDLSNISEWRVDLNAYSSSVKFHHRALNYYYFDYCIVTGRISEVGQNVIQPSVNTIEQAVSVAALQNELFMQYYRNLSRLLGEAK